MDLDELLKDLRAKRLSYLSVRRDAEDKLWGAVVEAVKALQDAEEKRRKGGRPPKMEEAA